jgi:hypothetical protein
MIKKKFSTGYLIIFFIMPFAGIFPEDAHAGK